MSLKMHVCLYVLSLIQVCMCSPQSRELYQALVCEVVEIQIGRSRHLVSCQESSRNLQKKPAI